MRAREFSVALPKLTKERLKKETVKIEATAAELRIVFKLQTYSPLRSPHATNSILLEVTPCLVKPMSLVCNGGFLFVVSSIYTQSI